MFHSYYHNIISLACGDFETMKIPVPMSYYTLGVLKADIPQPLVEWMCCCIPRVILVGETWTAGIRHNDCGDSCFEVVPQMERRELH